MTAGTAADLPSSRPAVLVGTSGWSFKEWKGSFYPKDLPDDNLLSYYATKFPTVEINNTFYRMPKAEMLENWARSTPESFRFSIKASRRITHMSRLKADSAADSVDYLYRNLTALGAKRGPVLYQLPPFLKKDLPRLKEFLALLPAAHGAAFEFRNDTWFDDEVYALLKDAGAALCFSEREDGSAPALVETAPWGYVRLRLETYSEADLEQWAGRLAKTGWNEVYVYFMHEPTAPSYAQTLMKFKA